MAFRRCDPEHDSEHYNTLPPSLNLHRLARNKKSPVVGTDICLDIPASLSPWPRESVCTTGD